jgi:hypothetical protein
MIAVVRIHWSSKTLIVTTENGHLHPDSLVFLGSEQFPYKGVLDNLANRAFAAGTNAWTDTDHTAYTITTAGKDGSGILADIYLGR